MLPAFFAPSKTQEFGLLLLGLVAGPEEGRVAHEVREVIGEHLGPIGLEGVALMEVAKAPERQEVEVITDVYLLRLSEHLLLGDPKGGLGDRDGEVVYLDAVQLIERYTDGAVLRNDEGRLPRVAGLLAELVLDDSVLDGAQLPVRLGKEVARAARGVTDGDGGNLVVQPRQGLLAFRRRPLALGLVQFVPQLVEEERLEAALDVLHARVVHAPGHGGSRVSVPSNTPPKMTPEISRQSKSWDASVMASSISGVICGTIMEESANSPPFTYGKAARSSSMYSSRLSRGVSIASNRSTSLRRSLAGSPSQYLPNAWCDCRRSASSA